MRPPQTIELTGNSTMRGTITLVLDHTDIEMLADAVAAHMVERADKLRKVLDEWAAEWIDEYVSDKIDIAMKVHINQAHGSR